MYNNLKKFHREHFRPQFPGKYKIISFLIVGNTVQTVGILRTNGVKIVQIDFSDNVAIGRVDFNDFVSIPDIGVYEAIYIF